MFCILCCEGVSKFLTSLVIIIRFFLFQEYCKQIDRAWTSFIPFLPTDLSFPGLFHIKNWINKRRQTHAGSMKNQLSCLNHGLMWYFGFNLTRIDLKIPIYKFVNSFMSDHVKKTASTFDQDFLDTFCSQVDVYTGRDRKMLSIACWIIIGSFEFLSFSFYFYFIFVFFIDIRLVYWYAAYRTTQSFDGRYTS